MDWLNCPQYFWARLFFERSLAILYGVAFLSAFNQFPALLGEKGLLPAPHYLRRVPFKYTPSIFHLHYSDRFLKLICAIGMVISIALAFGLSAFLHPVVHILLWLTLYVFYLSISNVGQIFYGFGWESMLCEAGFFMAFMGPEWMTPNWIPILILRWMLIRTEIGAGLIKLRGDRCWRDLTALYFHHETQPMPNPLSRLFHHFPKKILRGGVIFSHLVQVVAPVGLIFPQPIATISGTLIIFHQFILIVAGNYSWLNWITVVLGFLAIAGPHSGFDLLPAPGWFQIMLIGLAIFTLFLSYQPLKNLFSRRQLMNYCWNRFRLVCAYGAFGSVTQKRYELVLEGSQDGVSWEEYHFKGKPGDLRKIPPQVAPYHLRLDWLMWFLPFAVMVEENKIYVVDREQWFLRFVQKLLQVDPQTLKLIRSAPFGGKVKYIRVKYYLYEFTTPKEKSETKNIWKRKYIDEYLPALQLEDFVERSL